MIATSKSYLAVTHDGGKTIELLFLAPEPVTAFLRSAWGVLYVGTKNSTGQGGIFAAPLDGGPFQVVHQACPDGGLPADGGCDIHVRCLGERAGLLFACGDNWMDHMALGESSDDGAHFTSLLQYVDIGGLGCAGTDIEETCGLVWCGENGLVGLFAIDGGGCPVPDAGAPTKVGGGCNCGTAGGGAAALTLLSLYAIRRRRSGRHSSSSAR